MGYAFLSYARADQDYIRRLAAEAKRRGIEVWFDTAIESGERWADVIETELRGSDAFVALITPRSRVSEWCKRELLLADHLGKPLLPLVFRGTEVPMLLVDRQYDEVTDEQPPDTRWFARLADTLGAATSPRPAAGSPSNDDPRSAQRAAELAAMDATLLEVPRGYGASMTYLNMAKARLADPTPMTSALQNHLGKLLRDRSKFFQRDAQPILEQLEARPEYSPPPSRRAVDLRLAPGFPRRPPTSR